MRKLWVLVAVLAVGQAGLTTLRAQEGPPPDAPPVPGVGAETPDVVGLPVTIGPGCTPFNSWDEPPGPAENAWSECAIPAWHGLYFGVEALALQRQRLEHTPLGVLDPGTTGTTADSSIESVTVSATKGGKTQTNTVNLPVEFISPVVKFLDSGTGAPAGSPSFGEFRDLNMPFAPGVRTTIGYRVGDGAIEFTGFYIPTSTTSHTYSSHNDFPSTNPDASLPFTSATVPGLAAKGLTLVSVNTFPPEPFPSFANFPGNQNRFDLPFFNAPKGFTGDKGLWLQADQVNVNFASQLATAELNWRQSVPGDFGMMWLTGIRYTYLREVFGILTIDDPTNDPTTNALYQTETRNQVVTLQTGFELAGNLVPWLTASAAVKAGVGPNFVSSRVLLQRGDGVIGFDGSRSTTVLGQTYELNLSLEAHLTDNLHVRAGYNLFWLVGIAEAAQQYDPDLSHTTGNDRNGGSALFHGPSLAVVLTW